MIVIGQGVVLSPGDGTNGNNPVVGWRNLVTVDNITADTEDSDYPASNLANPSTVSKWKGEVVSGSQRIVVTVDSEDEIDFVGIARGNFAAAGIAVSIEVKPTISDDWEEVVAQFLPSDDGPIICLFDPQSVYQISILFDQIDATPPEAAVVYVGKSLRLERRIYVGHTPIPYGRESRIVTGLAESGDFLGRVMLAETLETAVDLQNITPAWYRTYMDPFIVASKTLPFFFAWRPQAYPYETGFAWMTNNPKPVNQRNNGMMSISLTMGGIALR